MQRLICTLPAARIGNSICSQRYPSLKRGFKALCRGADGQVARSGDSHCLVPQFIFKRKLILNPSVDDKASQCCAGIERASKTCTLSANPAVRRFAQSNPTPMRVAFRHLTRARRLIPSCGMIIVKLSGIPTGVATSKEAPVAERLRTWQSITPAGPNAIIPAFKTLRRCVARRSSIESWLSWLRSKQSTFPSFPVKSALGIKSPSVLPAKTPPARHLDGPQRPLPLRCHERRRSEQDASYYRPACSWQLEPSLSASAALLHCGSDQTP